MALSTTFNRLKREIGIKKCVIVEGNVGDVYLNDKKQIVDLKQYLMDMLKAMDYDDVLYWDRIDGVDGDVSRLDVVDKVEVEGDAYSFDDDEEETPKEEQKTGSGLFKEPAEIFNIIFKNLKKPNKKIAFVLNWADYLFSAGGQLPPDERELLTLLGKAIKDKKIDYLSSEVNESTVVLITSKLSMFPISFYQGNPEVACLTLSRPDREEREKMLEKIESGFEVKLKPGESLLTCDKKNEYIDMLDDFTNREIIQMARLSRKEGKMPFEQLYLLFKYGEKDNPWEKLDYKAVKNIKKILAERVVGQDEAIAKIEKVVVKAYMGLTGIHKSSSRSAPKGVLFFVGPTGVGKTELSKALAKFLFGDEQACIRFDMSEYAQENSDQKLIGAPPGYVGYEEGGQLTNAVREKPFSIILFDEIEKAAKPNPRILDIFLQILEDGRLTDSKGETVDFKNTIIILTSNLGSEYLLDGVENGEVTKETHDKIDMLLKTNFRPEFLNRLNAIVTFKPLTQNEVGQIVELMLQSLKERLSEKQLGFEITDCAKRLIVENGYDMIFGARPLKRFIEKHVETEIAKQIIAGKIKPNSVVTVDAEGDNLVIKN